MRIVVDLDARGFAREQHRPRPAKQIHKAALGWDHRQQLPQQPSLPPRPFQDGFSHPSLSASLCALCVSALNSLLCHLPFAICHHVLPPSVLSPAPPASRSEEHTIPSKSQSTPGTSANGRCGSAA